MREVKDDIDYARWMAPAEARQVVRASTLAGLVKERISGRTTLTGRTLPWAKTYPSFRFRDGETTVWAGPNGHGKSALLNQVMLDLMRQGERAFIASLEMPMVATMERLCQQGSGDSRPLPQYVDALHAWTDGRLWLYDHIGQEKPEKLAAVLRYVRSEFDVKHLVVDSLMRVVAGTDNYNAQKDFVTKLCVLGFDAGCHLHLVAHSRKAEHETTRMDKWSVKGASEITDQCDNLFLLQRNKEKEEEAHKVMPNATILSGPDATLTLAKQRHGEWEGTINLWYDAGAKSFRGESIPGGASPCLPLEEKIDAVPF